MVSSGRNLESEHVSSIAQGKVWTGEDALRYGLIDELGDLKDATVIAAKLAKLDQYEIEFKESPTTLFQQLVRSFSAHGLQLLKALSLNEVFHPKAVAPIDLTIDHIIKTSDLNDPRGLYLYCHDCPI